MSKQSGVACGRLQKIRYQKDTFIIGVFDCTEKFPFSPKVKQFTALGNMESPAIGQQYKLDGDYSYDQKWSAHQIKFVSYMTIMPSTSQGIELYLAQTGKWVKASQARNLVDAFGKETLDVIKTNPQLVAETISGLTIDRALQLQKSLLEMEHRELAMVECNQMLGNALRPSQLVKCIDKWGSRAPHVIRRNPFRLTELAGIGFIQADAVWSALKKDQNSAKRRLHAILYAMNELHMSTGDTVHKIQDVCDRVKKYGIEIDPNDFVTLKRGRFIYESTVVPGISLSLFADCENRISDKLIEMMQLGYGQKPLKVNTDGLTDGQKAAAELFEKENVMLLVGAPGTGKTYTTARLIQALWAAGHSVGLCAPTGKAAKQMSNAISSLVGSRINASTVHKLLGMIPSDKAGEDWAAEFGPHNPVRFTAMVVDETSMLDVRLAWKLISAINSNTKLLFVGDHYQLPSVGPGCVLRDMIEAEIPHCELTEVKRNAGEIVKACHKIKDGGKPRPKESLDLANGLNWRHFETSDKNEIIEVIKVLYSSKLVESEIVGDPFWEAQTIAPLNERGSLSCEALNTVLQEVLNPAAIKMEGSKLAVKDKVVQTRNTKAEGQFCTDDGEPIKEKSEFVIVNGDIGQIQNAMEKDIEIRFTDPGRITTMSAKKRELKLAYCLTCHKMQGSESPCIVLPLHSEFANSPISTREWIYTAFSRAKTALITVGELSVVRKMINRRGNVRRTTLAELLKQRVDL